MDTDCNFIVEQVGMEKEIPFLLEDRLVELGGKYSKAAEPWGVCSTCNSELLTSSNFFDQAHVVVDGNLITGTSRFIIVSLESPTQLCMSTGQNPASARPLAEALHELLAGRENVLSKGVEMEGPQGGRFPAM